MKAPHGDLPDVNVWIALSAPLHGHHALAKAYWQGTAAKKIWFCRQTMLGLARLLGHRAVMGDSPPQDSAAAWMSWQAFMQLPEVGMLAEPAGIDDHFQKLIASGPPWPARMWPDAFLAAFAHVSGLRLISFDRDFSRFTGLDWLHLAPEGVSA